MARPDLGLAVLVCLLVVRDKQQNSAVLPILTLHRYELCCTSTWTACLEKSLTKGEIVAVSLTVG